MKHVKTVILGIVGATTFVSLILLGLFQKAKLYHENVSDLLTPGVIVGTAIGCVACFLPLLLSLIFASPSKPNRVPSANKKSRTEAR